MKCPLCGKHAETERGLRKHLTGKRSYGGHELKDGEASDIAFHVARGTYQVASSPSDTPRASDSRQVDVNSSMPPPDDPYALFLWDLFRTLVVNKQLPKYQFERRIDAVLSLFLPELLSTHFGKPVEIVVPEFPIKKPRSNQSTNIDYLLFRGADRNSGERAWIFFELKTDDLSIRPDQVEIYGAAVRRGMPALFQELLQIRGATQQSQKYDQLLRRIREFPVEDPTIPIEIVYLAPKKMDCADRLSNFHSLTFSQWRNADLKKHADVWRLFRAIVLPALGMGG